MDQELLTTLLNQNSILIQTLNESVNALKTAVEKIPTFVTANTESIDYTDPTYASMDENELEASSEGEFIFVTGFTEEQLAEFANGELDGIADYS